MSSSPPLSPTAILWNGFDGEVAQRPRLPMFCGVPFQLVDDTMYLATARSDAARRLTATTPGIMRSLSHQTTVHTERCVGHVRGPIQWSETITAWGSGVGVNDVFICTSPRRDFDVPENRLLVWLLRRLVTAGRRAGGDVANLFETADVDHVREQGRVAAKHLSHPSLRGISAKKLDGREWRLVRKSRHLDTYGPAIRLADRVARPFGGEDAASICSAATREHHRVMLLILDAMRARGQAVPMLTVRGDFVESGPLRYRNPYVMVDRRLSATSGMYFSGVRVVTRAETAVTEGEPSHLVVGPSDAAALVDATLGTRIAAAGSRRAEPTTLTPAGPHPAPHPNPHPGQTQSASGFVQLPGSYSS